MSMKTGEVEVEATGLQVLSKAQAQLPFNIRAHNMPTEAIGLKHRYLQLRYPHLQRNLRLRSQVSKRISDYLQDIHGFVNVNTPTLTRHTSGGSHLFIVPYAAGSSAANVPPPANKCESVNGINAKSTFKSNSGDSRINSSSVLNISSSSSNVRNNDDSGSNSAISIESESMSKYYCLAQSPQTYKQLLMMGGLDKYYQFAVCYRDEKGTPERQPEFMQVDLEMSDVTAEEVQRLVEGMLQYSWPEDCNGGPTPETPFPVMTYSAAMKHYGSDKPDTRFQWLLQDAAAALQEARCGGITALQELISHPQGTATAFVVPTGQKHLSKSACESWNSLASREHGLGGVSVCHVRQDGSLKGSQLATQLNRTGGAKQLLASLGAVPGDTVVVALGPESNVLSCMGKLRLLAAAELEATGVFVRNKQELRFVWVVDFPLFEPGEDGSSLVSVHHPFTQPHPHDAHLLDTDPLKVRSQHYDLVCNGCEVGGGSVRIHDPEMQQRVLGILQLPPGDLQYFVDALAMGTPPHAGIALGFDRLVSLMCGSESIREVIAFPKNSQGHCTMSGAPSDISRELKQRYSIKENS
uniref:Aspartate--tRNA ligase n=1 Tax=Hirondellea gigas TaxID=1518452 RepID=A0A6A7G2S6_9CRUS